MSAPLNVQRNDYHKNRKRNDIPTPPALAEYLCELVISILPLQKKPIVLDPACGRGYLLRPFKDAGCYTAGIDTVHKPNMNYMNGFQKKNFLAVTKGELDYKPDLVVLNPPFNFSASVVDDIERAQLTRKMVPELFALKVFEIWGRVPLMLFAPMGLVLNQRMHSKRYKVLRDHKHAVITGRIALPLNIFKGVEFHAEILLFNLPKLKAHYWLPDEVVEKRLREQKKLGK